MDGRIARMTNTTSDFGREIDSLADVITFGVAPATLAFAWGIRAPEMRQDLWFADWLPAIGYLMAFLYLTCGAARLARFNVQTNPRPKNPGRPDRRYFVGLPIPPAAGMLAAIVHFCGGYPIQDWLPWGVLWLGLILLLAFLMISTWRYTSFKDMGFSRMPSLLMVVSLATSIYLIWNFSQPVLLAMASGFVVSGILTRIGGLLRRGSRGRSEHPARIHRRGSMKRLAMRSTCHPLASRFVGRPLSIFRKPLMPAILCAALAASCGYRVVGSANTIPDRIQNVSIKTFQKRHHGIPRSNNT